MAAANVLESDPSLRCFAAQVEVDSSFRRKTWRPLEYAIAIYKTRSSLGKCFCVTGLSWSCRFRVALLVKLGSSLPTGKPYQLHSTY